MTRCFDGVDAVEGVILEGHFHKISFYEFDFLGETSLGGVYCSSINSTVNWEGEGFSLIVIVIEADNITFCEEGHFSCRTSNPTANIKHQISLLYPQL